MKKIKYLIIFLFLFPIMVNAATCTREGEKYRITDPDIGLVDYGSGYYNYYCLGIEHCIAKDGKYYNINSELVTLQEYYTSCGCRKDGNTYYDNQGNETTEANYNRICLEVGKCSIKNGKYYDNDYKEVTQEEFNRVCGCRIEDNKYYDDHGSETTVENYNKVCLNIGICSIKDGKYYDNEYRETTQENFERICGCRTDNGKYYGKNGIETTQEEYERQCVNPDTGIRNIILISLLALIMFSVSLFILNRQRFIKVLFF